MSDHTRPKCGNAEDFSTNAPRPYRWLGGRQCFTQSDLRYFNGPLQLEHLSEYTPSDEP